MYLNKISQVIESFIKVEIMIKLFDDIIGVGNYVIVRMEENMWINGILE